MSILDDPRRRAPKVVLTIAGSDSSCGAGLQADIKTFQDMKVYGVCAVTAVTSQNTSGVVDVQPLSADTVGTQAETALSGFPVDAIKTGMLFSAAIARRVADIVQIRQGMTPLVIDPVLRAHTGAPLADTDLLAAIRERLLPLATVVTPNAAEATELSRIRIRNVADAEQAAIELCSMGARAVVVTGIPTHEGIADVYCDSGNLGQITLPRLPHANVHGTGCTFAAAMAAGLALGLPFAEALKGAKRYAHDSIANAASFGDGQQMAGHGVLSFD